MANMMSKGSAPGHKLKDVPKLQALKPKHYKIPKIKYVVQGKNGEKPVMSLGKIFKAYGNYLKELENFSQTYKTDYAATMVINYLKIKKHKGHLKKCYNKYKLDKDNFEEVVKIAEEFRGSSDSENRGTFSSFYQAIMRINLPLKEIKKVLDKDKNLIQNILSDKGITKDVKKSLIHPQNEFFKFADKSKISKKYLDKEFFESFGDLYHLSLDIPKGLNDFGGGDLLDDLNLICRKKFTLKDKSNNKTKKNSNADVKKFVRSIINKTESVENKVSEILEKYELRTDDLTPKQYKKFSSKFDLEKPHISYKEITNLEKCEKFLQNRKGKNTNRVGEYFASVYKYVKAIMRIKHKIGSKALKLIQDVEMDYNKFSSEAMEVIKTLKN